MQLINMNATNVFQNIILSNYIHIKVDLSRLLPLVLFHLMNMLNKVKIKISIVLCFHHKYVFVFLLLFCIYTTEPLTQADFIVMW